jgi:uncharacterized membrane protein (DUF485 family)
MSTHAAPPQAGNRDGHATDQIDWVAAADSPEYRELVRAKRAFVLPASIFFFSWYFGFILLAGYAESFMGESIYQGFTVGYGLALTQFVMVYVLGAMYVRRASREWDPLRERAVQRALGQSSEGQAPHGSNGEGSTTGISRSAPAGDHEEARR